MNILTVKYNNLYTCTQTRHVHTKGMQSMVVMRTGWLQELCGVWTFVQKAPSATLFLKVWSRMCRRLIPIKMIAMWVADGTNSIRDSTPILHIFSDQSIIQATVIQWQWCKLAREVPACTLPHMYSTRTWRLHEGNPLRTLPASYTALPQQTSPKKQNVKTMKINVSVVMSSLITSIKYGTSIEDGMTLHVRLRSTVLLHIIDSKFFESAVSTNGGGKHN